MQILTVETKYELEIKIFAISQLPSHLFMTMFAMNLLQFGLLWRDEVIEGRSTLASQFIFKPTAELSVRS